MPLDRVYLLPGFSDPRCGPERWQQLLAQGETDTVFLTWHWLRAWWETLGRGRLLLVAAERDGRISAIAPLYTDEGMIFLLGSGDGDCGDLVGDVDSPEHLAEVLAAARDQVAGFLGFQFFLLPKQSRTGKRLEAAAEILGMKSFCKEEVPVVAVDLQGRREEVEATLGRSMHKREEHLRRRGPLVVEQLSRPEAIRPHLADYYRQHLARWQAKDIASPFAEPDQRAFLERFLELAADTGWIRFLRIEWNGRPLAYEFAWYYQGTHYSAPWSFDIELAKFCPGHVLLRQSVLAALGAGLHSYDLGLGTQEYKFRLPAHTVGIQSWGLYPRDENPSEEQTSA